jgi:phosphoadenosine phosphosulfate reductase
MKNVLHNPAELNKLLSASTAQEIIAWAAHEFGHRATLASSFGAEDVVLIDMLCSAIASPRVFLLDTGRLHQETYDVVDRIRAHYGIVIDTYLPRTEALQELISSKGTNSFRDSVGDRRDCCHIRKVEPLARALSGVDAWITGLRRNQSVTRADLPIVEIDHGHGGILKISPLADWSADQVWDYIREHDVPYNKLHDRGFPSIGCAPCTRAIQPGEDIREFGFNLIARLRAQCTAKLSDFLDKPDEGFLPSTSLVFLVV